MKTGRVHHLPVIGVVILLGCGGRSALDDGPTVMSAAARDASRMSPAADATTPGRDATLHPVDAGKDSGRPDSAVDGGADAYTCIDITLSAGDLACVTNQDCVAGYSGEFCSGQCWPCDDKTTPMNAGAAARYQAELDALGHFACPPCGVIRVASVGCVAGKCVACPRGADGSVECGDGGTPRPEDAGLDAIADARLPSFDAPGELDAATPVDDAGGCTSPVVTFQLTAPPGTSWFVGGSDNSDAPGANWLTFFLPSGQQLSTSASAIQNLDCRSCSSRFPYGFGSWSADLPDGGVAGTWNGFALVAGACGSSSTACLTPLCMPPGRYIAKMCATDVSVGSGVTCVDVPFEYPTTETVTGVLP